MRLSRANIIFILLFAVVWSLLAAWTLSRPTDTFYEGDAKAYHEAAVNLAETGRYWFMDQPYTEREPGQSVWLAVIYLTLGRSLFAVFFIQGFLYLAAVVYFSSHLRQTISQRATYIFTGILLLYPPALHTIFSLNRECLTLSLFLFLTGLLLSLSVHGRWWKAVLAGCVFGFMILVYTPFLLFPAVIVVAFPLLKISWKYLPLVLLAAIAIVSIWGVRNYKLEGRFCLTGCYRSEVMWAVRGEQARDIHGFMPLRCLWAEYITRNWDDLPLSCSFNGTMHRLWPDDGLYLDERDIQLGQQGKNLIRQNFANYLWFSVFEVLEFHLPYVNGWGKAYNVAAAASTVLLYIGVFFWIPELKKLHRLQIFFILAIGYTVGLFTLTDATPRYFLPILFCYATFSAIGYDRIISRLKK